MKPTTGRRTFDRLFSLGIYRFGAVDARRALDATMAAAAFLPALGLCACAMSFDDPAGAQERLNGAAGVGGEELADVDHVAMQSGTAGVGGMAGGMATGSGSQYGANAQYGEITDPVLEPVPLRCNAPDREEYKAQHLADDGEQQPDGESPDASVDSLTLGDEGMEHTVLVVFDKSGSMSSPWDGRNKWQAASDTMIAAVTPFQSYLSVGAIFFPTDGDCGVDGIQSGRQIDFRGGADFLAEWETSMRRYAPDGGTPMSVALLQADRAIARACEMGVLERPFKVVLLTDGEPNCDGDMELLTSLPAKWKQHGIKTHVVGLPGSEAATALLEAMAEAGGTDTYLAEKGVGDDAYYAPGDPAELTGHMTMVLE